MSTLKRLYSWFLSLNVFLKILFLAFVWTVYTFMKFFLTLVAVDLGLVEYENTDVGKWDMEQARLRDEQFVRERNRMRMEEFEKAFKEMDDSWLDTSVLLLNDGKDSVR